MNFAYFGISVIFRRSVSVFARNPAGWLRASPRLPFPRVTICESPPQEPRSHNDRHESTLEEEGSRGAKSVERKLGRDARGFGRVFEGRSARQCARSSLGKGGPRSLGVQRKTTGRGDGRHFVALVPDFLHRLMRKIHKLPPTTARGSWASSGRPTLPPRFLHI